MKKKFMSVLLVLAIILSIFINVLATDKVSYTDEAEKLQLLGLFSGTDNGFDLNKEATRLEGLAMLVRLIGEEEQSKQFKNETSAFTDVPEWGEGYVNYAYKNGLTKGIGNNKFGSENLINAKDYMTFMLRALGYDDVRGDFSYDKSIEFAKEKQIISTEDKKELNSQAFLRDHLVKISFLSLQANIKDESQTLLEKLVEDGVVSRSAASKVSKIDDPDLEVHFIDVGQADSILIKKGNTSMLIDAGNNWDGDKIVDYLKVQGVEKLKFVIGTHPHADHIGGLDKVIDNFEIEKVIMPDIISTTQTFEDVLDSISSKNLSLSKGKAGDVYDLNGAQVKTIAPNNEKYGNLNNYSVVVKVTNGSNAFLFTGDAEKISEDEMIEKRASLLKADVLKLGHHGSVTSTSLEFLDLVDPKHAVISVGENNRYGHPDDEVLERLKDKEIQLYRTDLDGNIVAISNGKTIEFNKNQSGE